MCILYGEKNDRGIELEVLCNLYIIHVKEFDRDETKPWDSKICLLDYLKEKILKYIIKIYNSHLKLT